MSLKCSNSRLSKNIFDEMIIFQRLINYNYSFHLICFFYIYAIHNNKFTGKLIKKIKIKHYLEVSVWGDFTVLISDV